MFDYAFQAILNLMGKNTIFRIKTNCLNTNMIAVGGETGIATKVCNGNKKANP
ncbi:hypothetical protein [Draconibacterium orientale]|uniref:hypothetical protein n=1 Tax=Draconibacterium orientale TaxID=1168034 RepID=UPI0029C021EA|nr:hypothetical protein [Draconibacterium orientale]